MKDLYNLMDKAVKNLESGNSFYNSVPISGAELKEAKEKASSQDKDVLRVFQIYPDSRITTPESVLRFLRDDNPKKYANCPTTSIRRSFTTLKNNGLIDKSGLKVMGDYGRKTNGWKLTK